MGNWLVVGKDIPNLQYDKKILKVFIRCLGGFFSVRDIVFFKEAFSLYCKAGVRCVFSVSGSRSEVPARGLPLPGKTVLTLEKTKVLTEISLSTFVFSVPRFVCGAHSGVMGRRGMCAGGGGCAGLFPLARMCQPAGGGQLPPDGLFFSHCSRRASGRCLMCRFSKRALNPLPSGLAPMTPTMTGWLSCSQALRIRT